MHRAPNNLLLPHLQIQGRDHHIFEETSNMKDGNQEKNRRKPPGEKRNYTKKKNLQTNTFNISQKEIRKDTIFVKKEEDAIFKKEKEYLENKGSLGIQSMMEEMKNNLNKMFRR